MRTFDSDGVEIAFRIEGVGTPILLIHGFSSNHRINWVDTSWVKTLVSCGRKVILIDNRGHGESEKLYDEAAYGAPIMAEDCRRLLDHLGIARADVLGYSMGARIAAFLTINHPARVRSAVFGGLAETMIKGIPNSDTVSAAFEAPSLAHLADPRLIAYRRFAEMARGDMKALGACIRSSRQKITEEELAQISCPVLVAAGSEDRTAGSVAYLAERIPGSEQLVIEGRDHMTSVGDLRFKRTVEDFLARRP